MKRPPERPARRSSARPRRPNRPSPSTWHYALEGLLEEADRSGRPSRSSLSRVARDLGVGEQTVDARFREAIRLTDRRPRLSDDAVAAIRDRRDIPEAIAVLRTLGMTLGGAEIELAIRRHPGGALVGLVRRSDARSARRVQPSGSERAARAAVREP